MQQGEVLKFVDGNDLHLLVGLAVELTVLLLVNFHGNFRLSLDDVKISHQIAVLIEEKAGAKSARRAHLHHCLADLLDERTNLARRGRLGGGRIKLSGGSGRGNGGCFLRAGFRDASNDRTRDHQHRVAQIHDDRVRFFRENFPRNGGGVLELEGVGKIKLRAATEQGGEREIFLQRHGATIDHRLGFDKRAGVQS